MHFSLPLYFTIGTALRNRIAVGELVGFTILGLSVPLAGASVGAASLVRLSHVRSAAGDEERTYGLECLALRTCIVGATAIGIPTKLGVLVCCHGLFVVVLCGEK